MFECTDVLFLRLRGILFVVYMSLHKIVLETNIIMCILFSYLTRKYKFIREKVPFVLQLTNYLFKTTRNIDLSVKPNVVQMLEQFSACYIKLAFIIMFTTGGNQFSILSQMYSFPTLPPLSFRPS